MPLERRVPLEALARDFASGRAVPDLPEVHLFRAPVRPIRVRGFERLGAAAAEVLSAWPALGLARDDPAEPVDVAIETLADGVRVDQRTPVPAVTDYIDAEGAALGLIGALIAAYLARDPGLVCLHAAATRTPRGLVLTLGSTNAGKSTLAAHLVARGLRSFGDDRILLAPDARGGDRGISLPLTHKLRLPLPDDAAPGFARFVQARAHVGDGEAVRLRLKPGEAARFGAEAPLAAFVLLERVPGASASLEPAASGQVVRELVRQSFAPQLDAERVLAIMIGFAARVPGYRLVYGRSAEAAALIEAAFGAVSTLGARDAKVPS
ncbi:MAG TPA: hypothetical protein VMF53_07985 [Alphaproteobacteria bacterium]|nr:hypothetical protein [Alphaproteobacteria bacterium]